MPQPRAAFVSLGCAKNTVDSEVMLGRLATAGFVLCPEPRDADVVVVNTCGFLQEAEKEAYSVIGEMLELKRRGVVKAVVVAGCLPQRYGEEARGRFDGVDAVIGTNERDRIAEVCREALGGGREFSVGRNYPEHEVDRDRLRITPRHYAYLRVAEGCNHTCAFCIIPKIRGPFRSKPMEELLREARELVADGAVELCLIGQDVSEWGLDRYRKLKLHELLARLAEIDGLRWIRLLYMYPTMVTDEQIREIARNPKVVKYVDMPIQHTRERMLRRMRRGITQAKQEDLIARLRDRIPGLVLRTTIIAGMPGETETDFQELLDDVRRLRFERLGVFPYSREPGTAADGMDGQLPKREILRRQREILKIQAEIARENNLAKVGRSVEAIVDRVPERGPAEGRTYADAPEVDPRILLRVPRGTAPGTFLRAKVIGVRGPDLLGTSIGEGTPFPPLVASERNV